MRTDPTPPQDDRARCVDPVHILAATLLLAVTAFCAFGFQASRERPFNESWGIRVIYGVAGLACLLGILALLIPRKPKT